jgi:autotransporter-associated beta strand protein
MIKTYFLTICLLAVSTAHAQFVIDADTNDLPRAYGETWWFDDDDSGNGIVVSNINSSPTADGPLPGWAWTRTNFMVSTTQLVTEAGPADVVTNLTAAGPGDILAPGPVDSTVTNNQTVGNLVTEEDFFIGNGATLTLDQGGLMFRGVNHNVRTSSGTGFLTSGYTSGNGTNELFVTVTDNGTVYQIFGVEIVDDGATPVTLVVDSYDMVEEGEVRFSDENAYSGGTIVNRVQCWGANDECFGAGPVTVRDNNATVYLVTSSGSFSNDFYIAGNGWEDNFFGPVGALRFTSGSTLTGDIILTNDARIGNTSSGSNPARIEGTISGPFDLEFFEDGKFAIINSGHTYGNTTVDTGILQLGEPGAPAALPSNTTTIVASGGDLQGFTDYEGTVDLFGTLTPGFVHLAQTNSFKEAIFRAGSTIRMDLSIEDKDLLHFEDLTIEGGTVELNIIGELLNGNYAIMTYSNLLGTPVGLALSGDTGRKTATLVTNTVAKQINVNVTGATPPLAWTPTGGSDVWDLDTTANWKFGIGGAQTFQTSDPVVISSAVETNLQLVGTLTPGVAFVAGTADFSFGGNGRFIGNGALNMIGSGSLTINNANDAFGFDTYKGLITVASGGTLILGNNGALGDISVGTVIESGGTLELNGKNIDFEPVSVAGAGVGGLGAIVNSFSVPLSYNLSDITLSNDTTFGGMFHWTVGFNNFATPGSLSTEGNPYNLTKVGANQVSLRIVDVDPALAQIDIEEGVFGFLNGTSGLGDPAATMNIESNATFFHNNPNAPAIKQFDFKDGSEMRSQSSGNIMDGEVKLTGTVLFDVDSGNLTVDAPVIGSGGIEKIDGGRLVFTTSNSYAGLTHIKDGWVSLGESTPDGSFGTGPVTITGSVSRIVVNRTTDASIPNPITGRGVIELFGTNKTEFGVIDLPHAGSIMIIGWPGNSPTLHVTDNSDIRIEELLTANNFTGEGIFSRKAERWS